MTAMSERRKPRLRDEAHPAREADPIACVARQGSLWRIRTDWLERLLGRQAPDWFNLEDDPRARQVKAGYRRTTWRFQLGDGTSTPPRVVVFAKVFDLPTWVDRIKNRVLGASVDREWRASLRAEAIGVQVARCLALGSETAPPRRLALLTEGLEGAASLSDAWVREVLHGRGSERQRNEAVIIDSIATLVSSAHERGFTHGDHHPNNILLVRIQRPPGVEAYYVDVHTARFASRPMSIRRTLNSLAQLDQYFHRVATRTQRLRFFKRYLHKRPSLRPSGDLAVEQRRLLARLARVTQRHAEHLARQWDRRLAGNDRYFKTLAVGDGWKVTVVLALERRHVFPEDHIPDRTVKDWRAILEPIVQRANTFAPRDIFDHGELRVQLGEPLGYLRRVAAVVFRTAAWREFERCHHSRHRDIFADLIMAYGEHRSNGLIDRTILVRDRSGYE